MKGFFFFRDSPAALAGGGDFLGIAGVVVLLGMIGEAAGGAGDFAAGVVSRRMEKTILHLGHEMVAKPWISSRRNRFLQDGFGQGNPTAIP